MMQTGNNHIDNERFLSLLHNAIGTKSQTAFAQDTGISKFTLNRYLSNGLTAVPRISTLEKIADASDGKVSLSELLYAVGLYSEAEKAASEGESKNTALEQTPVISEEEKQCRKEASELAENMKQYVSKAIKDTDIAALLDTFDMLYGKGFTLSIGEEYAYTKQRLCGNRLGSEFYTPVIATWSKSKETERGDKIWVRYAAVFALFYCKTIGSECVAPGVILRDCAFDVQTLASLDFPEIDFVMDQISDENENANLADYPLCFAAVPYSNSATNG